MNYQNIIESNAIHAMDLIKPREGGDAGWMHERIVKSIEDFEKDLGNEYQAGGRLVNFKDIVFSIEDVGYWGPDMIIFYGALPDGSHVQLLQHISQLNLLLVSVPRKDDLTQPRRKIGFQIDSTTPD